MSSKGPAFVKLHLSEILCRILNAKCISITSILLHVFIAKCYELVTFLGTVGILGIAVNESIVSSKIKLFYHLLI